jgi:hypothetical protein
MDDYDLSVYDAITGDLLAEVSVEPLEYDTYNDGPPATVASLLRSFERGDEAIPNEPEGPGEPARDIKIAAVKERLSEAGGSRVAVYDARGLPENRRPVDYSDFE